MNNLFVKKIGDTDVREYAWRISRPYMGSQEEVDLEDLSKMDFQLNTLRWIPLHFRTSAFFRELLTTIRPYAMWSQSSRVNKFEDIEFPYYLSEVSKSYCESVKLNILESMEGADKSKQDSLRLELPIAHVTEYVYATDFRTWISFLKSLRDIYPELFLIYGKMIMRALNIKSLEEYKYQQVISDGYYTDLDTYLSLGIHQLGSMFVIKENISISLRAQLARHIGIKIIDNYYWKYSDETKLLKDRISIVMVVDSGMWEKVLRHRSCWIAHYELYESFILTYMNTYDKSFSDMLYCGGDKDKCSCRADVQARLEKKDPGLPCPFFMTRSEDIFDTITRRLMNSGESEITKKYMDLTYAIKEVL